MSSRRKLCVDSEHDTKVNIKTEMMNIEVKF